MCTTTTTCRQGPRSGCQTASIGPEGGAHHDYVYPHRVLIALSSVLVPNLQAKTHFFVLKSPRISTHPDCICVCRSHLQSSSSTAHGVWQVDLVFMLKTDQIAPAKVHGGWHCSEDIAPTPSKHTMEKDKSASCERRLYIASLQRCKSSCGDPSIFAKSPLKRMLRR